jgi:hypothetical protein
VHALRHGVVDRPRDVDVVDEDDGVDTADREDRGLGGHPDDGAVPLPADDEGPGGQAMAGVQAVQRVLGGGASRAAGQDVVRPGDVDVLAAGAVGVVLVRVASPPRVRVPDHDPGPLALAAGDRGETPRLADLDLVRRPLLAQGAGRAVGPGAERHEVVTDVFGHDAGEPALLAERVGHVGHLALQRPAVDPQGDDEVAGEPGRPVTPGDTREETLDLYAGAGAEGFGEPGARFRQRPRRVLDDVAHRQLVGDALRGGLARDGAVDDRDRGVGLDAYGTGPKVFPPCLTVICSNSTSGTSWVIVPRGVDTRIVFLSFQFFEVPLNRPCASVFPVKMRSFPPPPESRS